MFERGKFGLEYDPRQRREKPSGLGWLFVVIAVCALVSLGWSLSKRLRSGREDSAPPSVEVERPATTVPPEEKKPSAPVEPPAPEKPIVPEEAIVRRPVKVRNLLLRLEEAEKSRNLEMAVATIEQLRAFPGSPAADLDDALARRLGVLNLRWLFEKKNAQWVKAVTVKRGDSASRIAAENGSTLASLARLNGGKVDKVVLGVKLWVMDHPRFNLVIHRRTRTADLSLNGKFFKRYDLAGEVRGEAGAYEVPSQWKQFWGSIGVVLKLADRSELETLLPVGAPVLVSEM